MPIIGITASSNQTIKLTNFFSIATTTVSAASAVNVTFSNIPTTYTHLQIRLMGRTNRGFSGNYIDAIQFQVNGSPIQNKVHQLTGSGSTATSNATELPYVVQNGSGGTATNASLFSPVIVDILDYKNTNKNKTLRAFWGVDVNAAGGGIGLNSGYFATNDAISSISLYLVTSSSWLQNTTIALYGVL